MSEMTYAQNKVFTVMASPTARLDLAGTLVLWQEGVTLMTWQLCQLKLHKALQVADCFLYQVSEGLVQSRVSQVEGRK